jgi:hypothetical protein
VGCGGGGAKPNGVEKQTPKQILASVSAALGRVHSFHLAGTFTDKDGDSTVDGDVVLPGQVRLNIKNGARSADVVVAGDSAYLRGNKAFYESLGGNSARVAALLAGKWIKTPVSEAGFDEFLVIADPALIGRCMIGTHLGTLSKVGTDEVDGKPTVVIEDKGNVPGGSPGKAYIATKGDPLPLRVTQTGPETPGGTPDKQCKESRDTSDQSASDLRLSDWNKDIEIEVPKDAIDPSQLTPATAA